MIHEIIVWYTVPGSEVTRLLKEGVDVYTKTFGEYRKLGWGLKLGYFDADGRFYPLGNEYELDTFYRQETLRGDNYENK